MVVHRELEITVLAAHNLRNVKLGFGSMNPYAVLWIDSNSKASTHVAECGGTNPSWNCVVRMLCREALFGTTAKAKLVVEVFDTKPSSMRLAGTADVLLSELQKYVVREGEGGEWSEPKRMSLDVRRLRKGSYFKEKVIGSIDIQVRLARAANEADDLSGGVDRTVTYNGAPIQKHRNDLVHGQDFHSFNEDLPAPIESAQKTGQAAPVYYQHLYVEKPKGIWKGILDNPHPERVGVLWMGIGIF
ncbi:hypothetical protein M758_9G002100 [Ceratodon purpureus]|uniref:C2 domain-containing protein n=1 Tax=Ceratodon purpureus TaxID=3225 RepID=A0A8T0GNZ7_CERPU|nr:hypothetical protein KC19_9G002300 [Ceratodon purpureus]KAG0604708.1 hypothetical protein M758_9G002100 [Ceratodon purpureus]